MTLTLRSSGSCRRALALLGVGLVSLLLLVGTAAPAAAHATLVSTDPAEGAVLESAPATATLTFDETVRLSADSIRLFDDRGTEVDTTATARDETVTVDLPAEDLRDGTYHVVWRVVSADGHPVAGTLTFSVGQVSATTAPLPSLDSSAPRSVTTTLSVIRGLGYLGLLLAVGLAVFLCLVLPGAPQPAAHRLARLAEGSALLAGIAGLVVLPLTALDQAALGWAGLGRTATWAGIDGASRASYVMLAVGLLLLVLGLRETPPRKGWALAGAAIAVVGPALVGHTRAAEPRVLVIATDVLHVAAGSVWLGGLVGLAVVLPALRGRRDDTAEAISRFSTVGAVVLGALVATGSVLAWRILGSWSALFHTSYGLVLIAKIATVALAAAIAGWNRWLLLPLVRRAEGFVEQRTAATWMRRTVTVEALVLVVVVALTGFLVDRSPRADTASSPTGTTGAQIVRLSDDLRVVAVLSPRRIGTNVVRVQLQDASGEPVEPTRLPEVTLRSDALDLGSLELTSDAAGTFRAEVVLPTAGDWVLRISVRTSRFDNPVGEVTFRVSP